VLQAYTLLENRGYLEARPQSGYYVAPGLSSAFRCREPRGHGAAGICRPERSDRQMRERALDADYVPFATACPHHSLFPTKKLARLSGPSAGATLHHRPVRNELGVRAPSREIARRYLLAGAPLQHHELVITAAARRPSTSACAP